MVPALWLLVAAAVPADPQAALAALAPFGEVPPCSAQEVVIQERPEPEQDLGGTRMHVMNHRHEMQPVAKLPRLAGKSSAILPFLEHRNRRVVQRALDLACACPDAAAQNALLVFAKRHPCFRFAREAPGGIGLPDARFVAEEAARSPECEGIDTSSGFSEWLIGGPSDWRRWVNLEAQALAKKLDGGDPAARASAVAALQSMNPKEIRTGMAGLALVRTPLGWATVARAFPKEVDRKPNGEYVAFCMELGPPLLGNVASALGLERVDALVAILKVAPDVADHLSYIAVVERMTGELAARRKNEAQDPANPPEVRRFFEGVEESHAMTSPADYQKVAERVRRMFMGKDREGLRVFQKDDANSRQHRLLAGSYLAQLGDGSGLDLFEDPESVRSGQAHVIKSELESLRGKTKGEVRQRVEKLLKLYSGAQHPYEKVKDSLKAF